MQTVKDTRYKKNSHIFVTELKLQVILSMQLLHRMIGIHFYFYKIYFFFDKNGRIMFKLLKAPGVGVITK